MTATRYHVLRHIERVRHQLALEVDPAQMNAFAAWARDANALVFLPDATVRAPDGKILVAPDTGDPEPGAEVPFPIDAVKRKAATEAALESRGIRVAKSLPPVVAEIEVELRDARDVASRVLALFACAVRGESLESGKPIAASELEEKLPLAFAAMSTRERTFFADESPAHQDVVNHVWRYEAIATLAWAIGIAPELPFPTTVCDVSPLAKAVLATSNESLVASALLRPAPEILDALDLTYRLHWATNDARVKNVKPPADVEPGVVAERHYALNWLARDGDAEWDDVKTAT